MGLDLATILLLPRTVVRMLVVLVLVLVGNQNHGIIVVDPVGGTKIDPSRTRRHRRYHEEILPVVWIRLRILPQHLYHAIMGITRHP